MAIKQARLGPGNQIPVRIHFSNWVSIYSLKASLSVICFRKLIVSVTKGIRVVSKSCFADYAVSGFAYWRVFWSQFIAKYNMMAAKSLRHSYMSNSLPSCGFFSESIRLFKSLMNLMDHERIMGTLLTLQ